MKEWSLFIDDICDRRTAPWGGTRLRFPVRMAKPNNADDGHLMLWCRISSRRGGFFNWIWDWVVRWGLDIQVEVAWYKLIVNLKITETVRASWVRRMMVESAKHEVPSCENVKENQIHRTSIVVFVQPLSHRFLQTMNKGE